MVHVDPNNNWAAFGDYVQKHDDWYKVLVGKQVALINRRSALIDAVYRDDQHHTWKIRVRFEDGKSETIEKEGWANLDECVTFPCGVKIGRLAKEYAKRKKKSGNKKRNSPYTLPLQENTRKYSAKRMITGN